MLDAPFVDMLKVMIICNKAKVTRDDNKTITITPRDDGTKRRASTIVASNAATHSHDYAIDMQLSRVTSETGLHKIRKRTFNVSSPFYGEDDKVTITGNPSETALLRYCSRITPVSVAVITNHRTGWGKEGFLPRPKGRSFSGSKNR